MPICSPFVIARLNSIVNMAYLYTKFEDSGFGHYKDIIFKERPEA